MWKVIGLALVGITIVVFGFSLIDAGQNGDVSANAVLTNVEVDTSGYTRAIEPRDWQFPQDFGAHPDFQTEWWYYTGNLATEEGRRFGYQFTIFRRAITPAVTLSDSEWRSNQVYMAHFALSDIEANAYYHDQRFSRGAADLAGTRLDPVWSVWLEDWQVVAQNADATVTTMTALMAEDDVAIDFTLEQAKPPVLQGDNGLSPKSETPGNASYYYSLPRLLTEGTITVGGETFTVSGTSWMDQEFSTSALDDNALGWDWFGLQFDDNREMMVGQIRLTDGGKEPAFGGLYVREDGSTLYLDSAAIDITATDTWTSPHTDATYPGAWTITVDVGEDDLLVFNVEPLMADQELHGGEIAYWEGAVAISGDVTGYGYAELTGYVDEMTGRF